MTGSGVKIYETKKHTFITIFVGIICIMLGLKDMSSLESKAAIIIGILIILVAIYMLLTPMIIFGDEFIHFKSGNAAIRDLPYSEIESWSLQNEDKHVVFKLKSSSEEKKKNTITLNYCNLDKSNQEKFINQLNIKGVERIVVIEPEKKDDKKKKKEKK